MIEHISAVHRRLEEEIKASGGQRAWARLHGFSPQYINDVVRKRRPVCDRIAAELGFKRVVTWKDLRDTGRK